MRKLLTALVVAALAWLPAQAAGGKTVDILLGSTFTDEELAMVEDDSFNNIAVGMNIPLGERWSLQVDLDRNELGSTPSGSAYIFEVPVTLHYNTLPGIGRFDLNFGAGAGPVVTEDVTVAQEVVTTTVDTFNNSGQVTETEVTSIVETGPADQTTFEYHVGMDAVVWFDKGRRAGLMFGAQAINQFDEDDSDLNRIKIRYGIRIALDQ